MRRRIAVGFGVTAVACIAAIAAVSVASGSSGTALRPVFGLQPGVRPEPARSPGLHNPRVLVLTLNSAQGSNVDADPAGTSPGDSLTASGQLTAEGTDAGHLDLTGVLTSVATSSMRMQVTLTATLAHGQITAVGTLVESASVKGFRAGIVGGTLRYRNARGQLYVRLLQQGATLTYRLQP